MDRIKNWIWLKKHSLSAQHRRWADPIYPKILLFLGMAHTGIRLPSSLSLLTILLLLTGSGCSQAPEQKAFSAPAIPVIAAEVHEEEISLYIDAVGTIQPALFVQVRPQVSGMLSKAHFTQGQYVEKGTLLFSIDPLPYEIRLEEALITLEQNALSEKILKNKLERYALLHKKELISEQEREELETEHAQAAMNLRAAHARMRAAQIDLDNCSVLAPISGYADLIAVNPGNIVSALQITPLTTLSDVDSVFVEFPLTEKEFQQMQPKLTNGIALEIFSLSSPIQAIGYFSGYTPSYDIQSGLLWLRAVIPNKPRLFLPGQGVKVRIASSTLPSAKVIPQSAVKINQQGPYVYLIQEDNCVTIRQVTLAEEIEDKIIVTEGLQAADQIVIEGQLRLFPGCKVLR